MNIHEYQEIWTPEIGDEYYMTCYSGDKLQFLFSCCYQLSPYIICHHFAGKDNLLTA